MLEEVKGATGEELARPPLQEFLAISLEVKDVALIKAATQEEAAARYIIPEELAGMDIMVTVMTREEFDAMKAEAEARK